jgi:4-amino-4-deoxy-L-arabinose transferase-like glycosyltransferase
MLNQNSNTFIIVLILCFLPFMAAVIFHFKLLKEKLALGLLIIAAFLIRLLMTALDPFLYDWDERFHALVAKNMITEPFKPMLRVTPLLPYNVEAWCCNHIWLHKQPLFMWQMALSMKIFGVNEIAMRLPSAICGSIAVFFIYEIAKAWTKNDSISFLAAFFYALNIKYLDLVSGRAQLDHNDMIFVFYVTASIWAFTKYQSQKSKKWVILIGLFCGMAILCKWLTGLLIFAGWGGSVLFFKKERVILGNYVHIIISLLVTCVVFVPWQIYIMYNFPAEAAASYSSNFKHISENLSDPRSIWYHFQHLQEAYRLAILIPIGLYFTFVNKAFVKEFTFVFLTMLAVIYCFFSFLVATKMPAFPYPIMSIIFILMAIGVYYLFEEIKILSKWKSIIFVPTILLLGIFQLSPWKIIKDRKNNDYVNSKIHNTEIIKKLDEKKWREYVIFNAKTHEDVEIMFYKNLNVYQWYPEAQEIEILLKNGHKIAMLDYPTQHPPSYISYFPIIKIIKME